MPSFTLKAEYNFGFNNPQGVAVSNDGDIYVADTNNNRICKITNNVCTVIAGESPIVEQVDDGMLANEAQLDKPMNIALSYNDKIVYFTDSKAKRVCKIENGLIYTVAKTDFETHGIAVSKDGIIYYSEPEAGKVYKILKEGTQFSTISSPQVMCLNQTEEHLFVTSSKPSDSIYQIGSKGCEEKIYFGGCPNPSPFGVAVSKEGDIYIANNSCFINVYYGDGLSQKICIPENMKNIDGRIASLVVSLNGDVYVADSLKNRICVLKPPFKPIALKKFERDQINDITYPRYILEQMDPDLYVWIEVYSSRLSSIHKEIAQHLIDTNNIRDDRA